LGRFGRVKNHIIGKGKDLAMRNQRSFSVKFKRQIIAELLGGESRRAQLCRSHNISPSLLYHWKRQYSRGKFNNEPAEEAALEDRIETLERLVGRLTLENEFSRKGCKTVSISFTQTGNHRLAPARHQVCPAGCGLMKLARSRIYYNPRVRGRADES
jgi:transposase